MRAAVGDRLGVKAAGGIRDLATALAMIDAGASRIGTSSGRRDRQTSSPHAPGRLDAMPAYPLRALVLRKTKLGETDLDPDAPRR